MRRLYVFQLAVAVLLLFAVSTQAQEQGSTDVKTAVITEILTGTPTTRDWDMSDSCGTCHAPRKMEYNISRETTLRYHQFPREVKGEREQEDAESIPTIPSGSDLASRKKVQLQVYPEDIVIKRMKHTKVEWTNGSQFPLKLKHDVIHERLGEDPIIYPKCSFSFTFGPLEHPSGTVKYTIILPEETDRGEPAVINQPGKTTGRP